MNEIVRNLLNLKNKKHLLITGEKQIGKSSLFSFFKKNDYISTKLIKKNNYPCKVILNYKDKVLTIGEFVDGKMCPKIAQIDLASEFLEELIVCEDEFVYIDEIGFLERTSQKYVNKLKELFEKKRVIACIRKDEHDFLKYFYNLKDALLVEMNVEKSDLILLPPFLSKNHKIDTNYFNSVLVLSENKTITNAISNLNNNQGFILMFENQIYEYNQRINMLALLSRIFCKKIIRFKSNDKNLTPIYIPNNYKQEFIDECTDNLDKTLLNKYINETIYL